MMEATARKRGKIGRLQLGVCALTLDETVDAGVESYIADTERAKESGRVVVDGCLALVYAK